MVRELQKSFEKPSPIQSQVCLALTCEMFAHIFCRMMFFSFLSSEALNLLTIADPAVFDRHFLPSMARSPAPVPTGVFVTKCK